MKKKTIEYKKRQRVIKTKNRRDFYFSEKNFAHQERIGANKCTCKFKGRIFSEQIDVGKTPMLAHYDDLVYLGRGDTWEDCTYNMNARCSEISRGMIWM